MSNAPRPKPGDYTGRQRVTLQQQHAKEVQEAAERTSMATAARLEEETNTVFEENYRPTIVGGVEDQGVSLGGDHEVVTLIEDLENMTLGAGNHFSFVAGRKYKVSKAVASHLREKGYLY